MESRTLTYDNPLRGVRANLNVLTANDSEYTVWGDLAYNGNLAPFRGHYSAYLNRWTYAYILNGNHQPNENHGFSREDFGALTTWFKAVITQGERDETPRTSLV